MSVNNPGSSSISGSVSITGALPAGANIIGVVGIDQTTPGTTNGVQIVATSGDVVSFRQTTTAGAVALASHAYANGFVVTALTTNAGTVYVGGSTVSTASGYPLLAGQSISYNSANSAHAYIIGSDTSQVVAVTGT